MTAIEIGWAMRLTLHCIISLVTAIERSLNPLRVCDDQEEEEEEQVCNLVHNTFGMFSTPPK